MKKESLKLLLIVPVLAVLFLLPALTLVSAVPGSPLTRTPNYSVYENRSMATVPQMTAKGIWTGDYFSGWEKCLTDRFYGRDSWLEAHTAYEMLRGSASVNDVVLTGHVLLPQNDIPNYGARNYEQDGARAAADLKTIQDQIQSYGGTFLYVGVPEQRSVFRSEYPAYQETNAVHLQRTEAAFSDAMRRAGVNLLLMRPIFEEAKDLTAVYSTVDHHYNLHGAYETYRAVCDALLARGLSFPVVTEDHITFTQLQNPFLGTYNRKLYGLSPVTEKLWVFHSDMEVPFTRTDSGQGVSPTVFDLPKNDAENVYYNLYMGGDKAETILNTGRGDLPKVLIWGDSFTNAFESIAWMSFGELRSLDLRYYTEKTLAQYIDDYRPDIVLCIRDDLSYLSPAGNGNIRGAS